MRYLLRADTRHARLLILQHRIRELLQYGTDAAVLYLALRYTIYGAVLLLPGDTTGAGPAWSQIHRAFRGDVGVGFICLVLGLLLSLSVLELVPPPAAQTFLLLTLGLSVAFAVGFLWGYVWAPGGYDMLAISFICWLCYLRERDR